MKLYCLEAYAHAGTGIAAEPGDVLEVDDEIGAWLQRDAPGCWSTTKPSARQVTAAHDRMMRAEDAKPGPVEEVMTSENTPISKKYKTRGGA